MKSMGLVSGDNASCDLKFSPGYNKICGLWFSDTNFLAERF